MILSLTTKTAISYFTFAERITWQDRGEVTAVRKPQYKFLLCVVEKYVQQEKKHRQLHISSELVHPTRVSH